MIVSFGVYFNGTTLDEIAALVGVQASPAEVLSNLVRCGGPTACHALFKQPSLLVLQWVHTVQASP